MSNLSGGKRTKGVDLLRAGLRDSQLIAAQLLEWCLSDRLDEGSVVGKIVDLQKIFLAKFCLLDHFIDFCLCFGVATMLFFLIYEGSLTWSC